MCILQETRLANSDLQSLTSKQYDKIFSSTYNSKQRGVSVLVNKNFPLIDNTSITDPDGRFVIMKVSINHIELSLVNIYGLNSDDPSFFHN